ncbi:YifB family Mg chelatase-like AAA ATPase [Aquicella siphonis]|nr:YifB family Mg chelatase-like AAA ATPase [Aquicella siphonis]
MALAIVYSRSSSGITAPLVTVEAHLAFGMAGFFIVGLPEAAVKESRDRVRSALVNSNFEFPSRRITVNLAPADLPKEGAGFDLPIALGILAASGQIPRDRLEESEFTGELALSGDLRPVRGVLTMTLGAHHAGRRLIVPEVNAMEASLADQATVLSANHLLQVCAYLKGEQNLPRSVRPRFDPENENTPDLAEVKGQPHAKRALEIAAAGRHSLLYIGPPGTGKTMLASRLPGILPPLQEDEALEAAAVASLSHRGFNPLHWRRISFRSPHHSSSSAALVGGGRPPRPGEISLAHHGVLFLDELPEFNRQALECLREPLESGSITISRAAVQAVFPARFQLVAAMNPCPCGYAGSTQEFCQCDTEKIKRYLGKLSGPLLDRIDMQVEVTRPRPELLIKPGSYPDETSAEVRGRVMYARQRQQQRQGKCNAMLTAGELDSYCLLDAQARDLLAQVMLRFGLSARVCHRLVKMARTIADLADMEVITLEHLGEALNYRCLDRSRMMI